MDTRADPEDASDSGNTARAAGTHLPWCRVPSRVRRWAEDLLGTVARARTQPGGMSPGCVVRLHTADGRAMFVKAVGTGLNAGTVGLFRSETAILRHLPAVDYRPRLLGGYDDGEWVGIALEDVEGRYPRLADPADAAAVRSMLVRQAGELAGVRPDVEALARSAGKWLTTWRDNPITKLQPAWLAARHAEFDARVATLPDRLPPDQLVHWDVRNDNLLVRPDGRVVLLDWGMARLGPAWSDLLLLALSHADTERFDSDVAGIAGELGAGPDPDTVDDLLVLLGTRLIWAGTHEPVPGIPALDAFRVREGRRLLTAAERRLAQSTPR